MTIMKINQKQTRLPYSEEEKYQFYVEGKIRVAGPRRNRKKFYKGDRKKY